MLLDFYKRFRDVLSQKINTALTLHDHDGAPTTKEIEFWLKQLTEAETKILELDNQDGVQEYESLPLEARQKIEAIIMEYTGHE